MAKKPTYEELKQRVRDLEETEAERKKLEKTLRSSAQDWESTFDAIGDAVAIIKTDGTIQKCNKIMSDLVGEGFSDIISRKCWELVHGTAEPIDGCPIIRVQESKKRESMELEVDDRWYDIVVDPILDDEDNIINVVHIMTDITERKQAEETLRESEERYRSLVTKMMNGFALHEILCDDVGKPCDYRFLETNFAFEEMTGLKSSEVIGKRALEVLPQTESYWIDTYGKVALTGESIQFENYSQEFDKYFEVLAYSPQKGQFASVFTDITDRKKAEDTLRFTQFAIDSYSDGAFWMGIDARFIYVNDAACRLLGYTRDELLTMTVHDIDPGFPQEIWPDHWADLKSRGSFIIESHHRTKDGRIFPVEISVNYVKFGEKEYNCVFSRDVSERKLEEEEREKLRIQLQQAQKMEAIATLAGGIAHQFNNALSPVSVNLDMLEMDYPGDKKIANYTKQMKASAHRMAQLTSQLLAYARGGKYQAKTISINNFVENTLPVIHHVISPDTSIETDLTAEVLNIKADQTQMQMVLTAILVNASEAIEGKGHIRISTKKEEIDENFIKYHPDLKPGPHVCLTVEDNGKGMDKETRDRIFEPFFTTKFEGRGLGMASAFGIVRNHDGWISVYAEIGKGTVVRIYLPLLETQVEKPKIPEAEPFNGTGTILFIEDEKMVMDVTTALLEKLGYRVLGAKTGIEAIDIAKTFDGDIDLAILDIVLPDMNGKEIYSLIMEARPNLKVLVCSGDSIDGPAQEILDAGAEDFLQKPFSVSTLSEKLMKFMKSK